MPTKAAKSAKKATKKADRIAPLVQKEGPPDPHAEERREAMEKAALEAGIELDAVEVFRVERTKRKSPLGFVIEGTTTDGSPFVEAFRCVDELPAGDHTQLLMLTAPLDDERQFGIRQEILTTVVRASIVPEQVARYDSLIHDKDKLVDLLQLVRIASYLVGAYTGYPVGPSAE